MQVCNVKCTQRETNEGKNLKAKEQGRGAGERRKELAEDCEL